MAEIQMQDYEEIRRDNDDHKYDDLKIDKTKVKIDHELRQKLLDIDMRLTAIEKQNGTKLRESENGESTDLDTHTMCYNGGVWQNCHESNICVCTAGFLGKQCEYSDGKDTSFMVVFHEGWNSPFGKRKTEHNLSKSVLPSDGIHLAGVEIHSDVRIKLYGFENHDHHSEGFLSLPLRFASTKYTIPSLPAYTASSKSDLKNVLVISPIKQNTTVSIHLKLKSGAITYESKTYKNNDTIKLVINEYNTLQLSHTSDLSGTMVTSSKPVIVISGNQCSYAVPANITLGFDSFISITVRSAAVDGFFLDGNSSNSRRSYFRISEGMNNFSTFSLSISAGLHHIEHRRKARFGLWVYGNKYPWDGYGYPAGMAYKAYN
ncbi:Hypothetical predicted protein [Mytilus galloprovincialis]|uniref:EGF-like domain-containing protein n=1 Tax=Mytilus galloprovincialis TaxID=29158 RepID=A0A8B6DSU9_MYTGA|nr:Hypothetical predicted protein [Mytilus galloprovincialis]